MTLLKLPFVPVRNRHLRGLADLDDRLRRDIGLPERERPVGFDLTILLLMRTNL